MTLSWTEGGADRRDVGDAPVVSRSAMNAVANAAVDAETAPYISRKLMFVRTHTHNT